jgi:hypothetical protein
VKKYLQPALIMLNLTSHHNPTGTPAMQISLSFSPAEDNHVDVTRVVDAVYGVKSSPNVASAQTASNTPALGAQTPLAAQQEAASSTVNQSPAAAAPAQVAEFPNPTIAPIAVASATPATNGPAGVELDKNGIPWDVRIHSGGKNDDGSYKKTAAGVWAKRKGVDDLTVSNVTKELQNLMAAQVGHAAPPAGLPAGGVLGNPVNVPHQEAVPLPNDPNAFVAQPIVQAPVTPTIAPMPTGAPVLAPNVAPMPAPMPQPAATPTTFAELAQWLAPNLEGSGGKLSTAHVEHFCRQCNIVDVNGAGDFSLVAQRPDAVVWLHQAFTAQLAAM